MPSNLSLVASLVLMVGTLAVIGGVSSPVTGQQSLSIAVTNVSYPETPTVGEPFRLRVTIRNYDGSGQTYQINEVYADGEYGNPANARNIGQLPPGSSTTVSLPVTLDEAGWHNFDINVNGGAVSGGVERITHPVTVQAIESRPPRVSLDVQETVPGSGRELNLTVSNGGKADIRDVTARLSSPDLQFVGNPGVASRLRSGTNRTFQYTTTIEEAGTHPVTVSLEYVKNGQARELTRTVTGDFAAPPNPGQIKLTGAEVSRTGAGVELAATASNIGSTPVDGVVVSIPDRPGVTPQTYFVGDVEASDFSSFTLTTQTAGNVSTLPIEVRYVVDGVEQTTARGVSLPDRQTPPPSRSDDGGSGLLFVAGGLAFAVVGLMAVVYFRRS